MSNNLKNDWVTAEPTGRVTSHRKGIQLVTVTIPDPATPGESIQSVYPFEVETIVTEWNGLTASLALSKVAENQQPVAIDESHIWTANEDNKQTRSFTLRRTYEKRPENLPE